MLLLSACFTGKQQSASNTKPSEARIGCAPTPADLNTPPGYDGKLAPLFKGLDVHHYPVTTTSKTAQKYFNQGLVLGFGFNHAEAARAFRQCAIEDPNCAMCYWGLAFVLGPNYNAPMEVDVLPAALEAIQQARLVMHNASVKERAMIEALATRYPPSKDVDGTPYYEAFANRMKELMQTYPDDLDIAVITAEALMNLHPWDMWEKNGTPRPWTPEIVQIIEGVLAKSPRHPQAAHLYIHAVEASKDPERALTASRMLESRVPGSGHLLHMPSHIYLNTGHYHDGTLANERAVKEDSSYIASCQVAGVYPIAYYPHNWHMLAACAALEGQGDRALEASKYMADFVVAKELMNEPFLAEGLQHYYSIPWFIMIKFAMWDAILREPAPDPQYRYASAIWNYAQGMAHAANGSFDRAAQNMKAIRDAGMDTSLTKQKVWGFNSVENILKLAEQILQGEVVRRQGHFDIAARFFEQAVAIEDQLVYVEPPDWFFSSRHHLGDALLKAGRYADAEKVYRTDLEEYKNNGWALMGLYKSLLGQGKSSEAQDVLLKFKEAWKYASVQLESSVI